MRSITACRTASPLRQLQFDHDAIVISFEVLLDDRVAAGVVGDARGSAGAAHADRPERHDPADPLTPGAIAAFDCHDECEANVARYAANRAFVLDGLRAAGFDDLALADGAFYVWAGIDHLIGSGRTTDSQALCATWLDELGLAQLPGSTSTRREATGRPVRWFN